jgi:hypothetical protein
LRSDRVSTDARFVDPLGMDDAEDNLILLSRRQLAWEELTEAAEWLEDLEAPLTAEQRAVMEQHIRENPDWDPVFPRLLVSPAELIRRSRERGYLGDDEPPAA